MKSASSLNGSVKGYQLKSSELAEVSPSSSTTFAASDLVELKRSPVVESPASPASPSNGYSSHEPLSNGVVPHFPVKKKKSLELLANNLMRKALAHTACKKNDTAIGPECNRDSRMDQQNEHSQLNEYGQVVPPASRLPIIGDSSYPSKESSWRIFYS